MPPALMSRFDLIFVLLDTPDETKDMKIAQHILKAHHAGEMSEQRINIPTTEITQEDVDSRMEIILPKIDPDIMRKYVAYARKNIYPIMEKEAHEHLLDFYMDLRKMGEGKDAPVPVTARQLEALVRLSEASARKIKIMKDIIRMVGERHSGGKAPLDEIYTEAEAEQIDRGHAEELISKMRRTGDVLSPDNAHLRLIR
jgi:replicative DNA helicase Mcm